VSSTGSFLAHQYFFNTLASNSDFSTADYLPQQFLYFLPLPQGQGPLRDGLLDTTFSGGTAKGCSIAMGSSAIGLLFDNTRRFW